MTKMARTKTNTQKAQKLTEYQDATDIQNNIFLCFSDFYKNNFYL